MPRRQDTLRLVAEYYQYELSITCDEPLLEGEMVRGYLFDLYRWFEEWCTRQGRDPVSYRAFMQRMWVLWGSREFGMVVQAHVTRNQQPFVLMPDFQARKACFNRVVAANPQLADLVLP